MFIKKSTCLHFVHSTSIYWIHYYVSCRIWGVGNTNVSIKNKTEHCPSFHKMSHGSSYSKAFRREKRFYSLLMREFPVTTCWLENTLSETFQALTNIVLIVTPPFLLQLYRWAENIVEKRKIWGSQLDLQNKTKRRPHCLSSYSTLFPSARLYLQSPATLPEFTPNNSWLFQKSNLPRNDLKKKKLSLLRICKRIC